MEADRPEIYFLHIPKTAGSSLAGLIRGAYPKERRIPAFQFRDLLKMSRAEINSYDCYSGHFATGLFSLLDRDIPTVTVLRDPFERSISQFHHMVKEMGGSSTRAARLFRFSFWLWGQTPLRRQQEKYVLPDFGDLQTRSLGVNLDLRSLLGAGRTLNYSRGLYEAQNGEEGASLLANAKRRLDSMAVVGTLERFDESVGLICDYLGIPPPEKAPEVNVSRGHAVGQSYRASGKIPPRTAARIDEITSLDRELYAYANRLLDARLSRERQNTQAERDASALARRIDHAPPPAGNLLPAYP